MTTSSWKRASDVAADDGNFFDEHGDDVTMPSTRVSEEEASTLNSYYCCCTYLLIKVLIRRMFDFLLLLSYSLSSALTFPCLTFFFFLPFLSPFPFPSFPSFPPFLCVFFIFLVSSRFYISSIVSSSLN